ncbi:MAG: lipid-binding SYLF domain-containing protein [Smithella sp.]
MKKIIQKFSLMAIAALILCGAVIYQTTAAIAADEKTQARELVERSRISLHDLLTDSKMGVMRDLMKDAKGIFIVPQLLRGAYVIGASGGSGVFLSRGKDNNWTGPAFYTVGGASIGLQIGGDASEVVLLAMSNRGVAAFHSNNFKLGANASVAAGPVGLGIGAQTANLSGDILSFSRAKGLYGGVSVQGSVVAARESMNTAFYGQKIQSPVEILVNPKVKNTQASALIDEVKKAARKKK